MRIYVRCAVRHKILVEATGSKKIYPVPYGTECFAFKRKVIHMKSLMGFRRKQMKIRHYISLQTPINTVLANQINDSIQLNKNRKHDSKEACL